MLDLASGEAKSLGPGQEARYLDTGHLIYLTADNAMVASPFDLDRGEITGAATPIVDFVAEGPGYTGINFALGASGAAVYAVGSTNQVEETLVMVDLNGRESPILGLPTGDFSGPRFDPTGRYLAFEIDGTLWIRDLVLGSQDLLSEEASFNPVWCADGSKLAFGASPAAGTVTHVLVRPSNLDSCSIILRREYAAARPVRRRKPIRSTRTVWRRNCRASSNATSTRENGFEVSMPVAAGMAIHWSGIRNVF